MSLLRIKRILVVMAMLDVAVFGGWIAREQLARTGDLVELPVEGFDPRDLLSGHYVQFRLVAEREAMAHTLPEEGLEAPESKSESRAYGEKVSFCLERGTDNKHRVTHRRADGEACTFITGTTAPHRVDFGVERFYVDERRADEVLTVGAGPSTYLVVTIDAAGAIHPVDLFVGGKSFAPRR